MPRPPGAIAILQYGQIERCACREQGKTEGHRRSDSQGTYNICSALIRAHQSTQSYSKCTNRSDRSQSSGYHLPLATWRVEPPEPWHPGVAWDSKETCTSAIEPWRPKRVLGERREDLKRRARGKSHGASWTESLKLNRVGPARDDRGSRAKHSIGRPERVQSRTIATGWYPMARRSYTGC